MLFYNPNLWLGLFYILLVQVAPFAPSSLRRLMTYLTPQPPERGTSKKSPRIGNQPVPQKYPSCANDQIIASSDPQPPERGTSKKSPRIGNQPVALNCPSNTNVLFHALTRLYGAQQWKETAHETQKSEKAYQEAKQMPAGASEFLARLDLVGEL